MANKKTHSEFISEMSKVNENIEVLSEYKTAKIKVKCRCKIDGCEWWAVPYNLSHDKSHCPRCSKRYRRTTDEFKSEMKLINPNIDILTDFKNTYVKVSCRCKIDGNVWDAAPSHLLNGRGCPKCKSTKNSNAFRKIHSQFINELNVINPYIEILSEYKTANKKVECRCKIEGCNHKWSAKPANLLSGKGCPKCTNHYHRTTDEFKSELYEINPNIEVLGEFIGTDIKVKCRCKIDGNIWHTIPYNLLSGMGCPVCSSSKGEKLISNWLNKNKYIFESQKSFKDLFGLGNGLLSYDFYIPSKKVLIEYQGEQHEHPVDFKGLGEDDAKERFKKQQEHDRRKREYAKFHGIELLEIWYYDFDNIENILLEKFGENNEFRE